MGTSPKPATRIGFGAIAVAALAAAYNLGRISAESDSQPQSRQDAANKNAPHLQSTLSVTRNRLANCEKTLQRSDPYLQKREKKPHTNEDKPTPSPDSDLSEQCLIASQPNDLHNMSMDCRDFWWLFKAYEEILGSSTIGCETVLSIRDLAQAQHSICTAIIKFLEDPSQPDVTSSILGLSAMENAYLFKSEHGDVDIDELVKNPACIARMQTE
ncbi:hypothetical protein WME99_08420 [Sorangium sp. So ce136]|uniref:hypothetical protein n=1 Tax=Sorangium sp. So ce136 TaxID=3133284 RepID=UPI003F02D71D